MSTGTAAITGVGLAVAGLRRHADLLAPHPRAGTGFDPDAQPLRRGMRHKDRASRLALAATDLALRDAGLLGAELPSSQVANAAVIVSSNFGNLDTVCEFTDTIRDKTVTGLSPMRVPHMSSNVTACWVALEYGMRGPNVTLCNGTVSGLDAVYWARNLVAAGRANFAIVIGVEPDTAPVARLHREHGARSWLDGAACLIIEPVRHARQRGATSRAVIGGYGRAADMESAVGQARRHGTEQVGLWLAAGAGGASAVDLTARLGCCSGALGVLQAAACVAWFDDANTEPALAVAGAGTDTEEDAEGDSSGVAALVLTHPGAPAPNGSGT